MKGGFLIKDLKEFIFENNILKNEEYYKSKYHKNYLNYYDFDDYLIRNEDINWDLYNQKLLNLGYQNIEYKNFKVEDDLKEIFSLNMMKKYYFIPINTKDRLLNIIMLNPFLDWLIDYIKYELNLNINIMIAKKIEFENYFKEIELKNQNKNYLYLSDFNYMDEKNELNTVKLLDNILKTAIELNVSDIHFNPYEEFVEIKFRINGVITNIINKNKRTYGLLKSRIKLISNLKITEKRLPQDGKFLYKNYEFRVSFIPVLLDESIAIRVLNKNGIDFSFKSINMDEKTRKKIMKMTDLSSGLIVFVGPTGSGKTTTLYTILKNISKEEKRILTVEDPIECKFNDIMQIQINENIGVEFDNIMKSVLRQDPDILMVGEIRDKKSLNLAFKASITGHLVLTSIHSKDSISSIIRFLEMGLDRYLIKESIKGIVSQRLFKSLCNCKIKYKISDYEKKELDITDDIFLYKKNGCENCNFTGIKGYLALYEIFHFDEFVKDILDKNENIENIKAMLNKKGFISINQKAKAYVLNGQISFKEYLKTLYYIGD